MKEKKCTKCGEVKPFSEYNKDKTKKFGLASWCRRCTKQYAEDNKERIAERKKAYRKKNKAEISSYNKKYKKENSLAISEKYKEWSAKNKEKKSEHWKAWYCANKDKKAAYQKIYKRNRLKADPIFRMTHNLGCGLRKAMKGTSKPKKTMELLGCSQEYLREHLSAQFTEGMTLENYGEWHIDHIQAVSLFDHNDPEQVAICWHYTNMQPMWAKDNIIKSNKIVTEHQIKLL